MDFEKLLEECRADVERFVKFRLPSVCDAEDVLQEVYFAAFRQFAFLKNRENFKAWILGIARHKCNDYFREKAKLLEIPIDEVSENKLCYGSGGITEISAAAETMKKLGDKEKQILYLYFWEELPQADIAARLKIPLGTVKSRLHAAKQKFRAQYPHSAEQMKGVFTMKTLPKILPDYVIKRSSEPPFAVRHEELPGMLIIPRKGEKVSFCMYDRPEKKLTGVYHLEAIGEVVIHGIHGTEIASEYAEDDGEKYNFCAAYRFPLPVPGRYDGGR